MLGEAGKSDAAESKPHGRRFKSRAAHLGLLRRVSGFLPKADAAERCGPLVSRRLKNCCDRVCLPVAPRSTSKAYGAQPALKMWAKVKSTPMAVITATIATNTQSVNLPFALRTCHLQFLTFQACRNPKCRFDSFKRNRTFYRQRHMITLRTKC